MSTMNVSLTPQLEKLVQDRVKSGRYTSASEVIREALRLMDEKDRLLGAKLDQLRQDIRDGLESGPATPWNPEEIKPQGLRRDVDAGLRQIDEGRVSPFDAAGVERIKRRGRHQLKRSEEPNDETQSDLPPLIARLRDPIAALCERHGVRELSIFGSILREDFDPDTSDVDAVVSFGPPKDESLARQQPRCLGTRMG
jgi:antitoxin ParD1/3/4